MLPQDSNPLETSLRSRPHEAAPDSPEPDAGHLSAIDPRIDRDEHEAILSPVVRPAEEPEEEVGFARSLTQQVRDSWNHSAAEETLHDWPETQAESASSHDAEAYRFEDSSARPLFPTATYFPPDAGPESGPSPESASSLRGSAQHELDSQAGQQGEHTAPAFPGAAPRPPVRRASFPARLLAERLIRPVSQATSQMSTLDWLSGTPFENPHQAPEPGEADELVTINLVLDLWGSHSSGTARERWRWRPPSSQ